MNTEEWFEIYMKNVLEGAKKINIPKDITQDTLHRKGYITKALDMAKIEGVYSGKMEFGFSERMVNYIIQIAYDMGRESAQYEAKAIRQSIKDDIMEFIKDEL